jgi:type IV secretion system protein VirB5
MTETPYMAARIEWNERYGSYIRRAQVATFIAAVTSVTTLMSAGFALYQSTQVKMVPYIVEVDKLGNAALGGVPHQIEDADPRVVRATLGGWLSAFRAVTPDLAVEKGYIDRVYALLHMEDPSTRKINDYYRNNSPFDRAKTVTVSVEISNIVPLSPFTWQIDWIETERDRTGKELKQSRYRGIATLAMSPPQDEAVIRLNPIGLYIKDFDWTAQL